MKPLNSLMSLTKSQIKKKQNQEEEAKKAGEMRKRSLETFKDSAKRNSDEQQGARPKKSRASGANTLAYLKDGAEVEATLKHGELAGVSTASKGAGRKTTAV